MLNSDLDIHMLLFYPLWYFSFLVNLKKQNREKDMWKYKTLN